MRTSFLGRSRFGKNFFAWGSGAICLLVVLLIKNTFIFQTILSLKQKIVQLQKREDQLKSQQQALGKILNTIPVPIWIKDREGKFIFVNEALLKTIDLPREVVLGKTNYDYFPQELADRFKENDKKAFANQTLQQEVSYELPSKSGGRGRDITVLTTNTHLPESCWGDSLLGVTLDISERKKTEESLRYSEKLYRTLAQNLPGAAIFLFDHDLRFLMVEGAALNRHGYDKTRMEGKTLGETVPPDRAKFLAPYYRAALEGIESTFEDFTAAGPVYLIKAVPVKDEQGRIFAGMVMAEDITARKQVEEKLQQLAAIVESSEDAIISRNLEGIILSWNKGAERLYGYTAEEMIDHSIATLGAPSRFNDLSEIMGGIGHGKGIEQYETVRKRKDGSLVDVALTVSPVWDSNGNIIGASSIARDITARKQAEQSLQAERDFARQVMNTMGQGLAVIDNESHYVYVNPAYAQLVGYTPEALLTMSPRVIAFPEDATKQIAFHAQWKAGKTASTETRIRRADGSELYVIVTAAPRIQNGVVAGAIAVLTDLTERREIERLKNEFISTVSHELRTPLTSIKGSLGLVLGSVAGELPSQAKALIEIAHKNSERLVRLTNDILDIEKIELGKMAFEMASVELASLIKQAIEANSAYGEQYGVTFRQKHALPGIEVKGDSDRLMQVMTNLLSNAAKFSPKGTEVHISMERHTNNIIRVKVKDHGPGIPPEFQPLIFQKFAQADAGNNRQKGGTGLGLSIARAIIEKHEGQIGFETRPGAGTTFYFDLPELEKPPAPVTRSNLTGSRQSNILICEDDPDVTTVLSVMLKEGGFNCDIAYNAIQAKALLAQHTYQAMTLDLVLPGQDGLSLLQELRAQEATRLLPIVVVSIKVEEGRRELKGQALPLIDWLGKPIDQQRLLNAVNHIAGILPAEKGLPRILHVEDNKDIRQLIQLLLEEVAEIETAQNLGEARQKLSEQNFDLVMFDLGLPDGSGLELLSLLKHPNRPPIPAVVFSAQQLDRKTAQQLDAVLIKTRSTNQQIVSTIKALVKRQEVLSTNKTTF